LIFIYFSILLDIRTNAFKPFFICSKMPTKRLKKPLVQKIMFLESNSSYYAYFRNMYLTLKEFCKEIICFNRRDLYFKYGKEEMNRMLLETIKKEKPDYIFTWLTWDEFCIETLLEIRKISPKTKTVVFFGDETAAFEHFSRYYALLFDYCFVSFKAFVKKYKQEGINTVFSTALTNTNAFHPLQIKKEFDVTFIGSLKDDASGRYKLIKYLKDNGIRLRVYGFGWEKCKELKDIYFGPLETEDMIKIINQSKINLCLSKDSFGKPEMKAKVFEVASCKSFVLCEYAPDYPEYFKENELVMFKNKEEMLNKVKYFLKNKEKREKIALASYKRTVRDYSLENELKHFFLKTYKNNSHRELPKINKKIFKITEKEIKLNILELKKNLKNYDYVGFQTQDCKELSYRNFFQLYSFEKTGKDISCCNYYVYTKQLGDYLLFLTKAALTLLDKDKFSSLLDINQLIVKKEYFLNNLKRFKAAFNGEKIDFVNAENTAIVSIPLIRIKDFKINDYEAIKKAFSLKFLYQLYSLAYQKIFFSLYPFALLLEIIKGKTFIFKNIYETVANKNFWVKLDKLK